MTQSSHRCLMEPRSPSLPFLDLTALFWRLRNCPVTRLDSADGLVICERQHQLRHVVLREVRVILDADITGTWRALGGELQCSEEAIPKSEEQSEVDISLSSPVHVVQPVHRTHRQDLLKLAKLVVGIGVLYEKLHRDCESEQNGDVDRQTG